MLSPRGWTGQSYLSDHSNVKNKRRRAPSSVSQSVMHPVINCWWTVKPRRAIQSKYTWEGPPSVWSPLTLTVGGVMRQTCRKAPKCKRFDCGDLTAPPRLMHQSYSSTVCICLFSSARQSHLYYCDMPGAVSWCLEILIPAELCAQL